MGKVINLQEKRTVKTTKESAIDFLEENFYKFDVYYVNIPLEVVRKFERQYHVTFIEVTICKETKEKLEEQFGFVINNAYLVL